MAPASCAGFGLAAPAVIFDAVADFDFEHFVGEDRHRFGFGGAIELQVDGGVAVFIIAEVDEAETEALRVFGECFDGFTCALEMHVDRAR